MGGRGPGGLVRKTALACCGKLPQIRSTARGRFIRYQRVGGSLISVSGPREDLQDTHGAVRRARPSCEAPLFAMPPAPMWSSEFSMVIHLELPQKEMLVEQPLVVSQRSTP